MNKRTRIDNARRIVAGGLLKQIVRQFLPFLTRTLIIYSLGELYAGLGGLFSSILQVLNLAELGFSEAMVFSMYQPLAEQDTEKVCALMNLYRRVYRLVAAVIGGIGLLLMPFLRSLISGEVPAGLNIYIIYLITLANTCAGYLIFAQDYALLTADQRGDVLNLTATAASLLEFLLRLGVLLVFRSYYLYCLISLIVTLFNNLYVHSRCRSFYPEISCRGQVGAGDLRQIREKLTGLFVSRLCGVCRNAFDSMTLSAFLGLNTVAIFQNYFMILRAVTGFATLVPTGILPGIGNSIARESQEKNHRDFRKFQLLLMWLAGWCTVCLLCLYQPFMRLWMGSERMLKTGQMAVFCIYFFSEMSGNLCYVYRQAAGLYQHRRYVPVLESGVNIALNILLVRRFGVIGVLASTIFCQLVINTLWSSGILYDYYFTDYRRRDYLLRLGGYAAVTALACGVTRAVCGLVPFTGIPELIIRGCICIAVPNLIFAAALRVFPEYGDAVEFITKKLLKRKRA